MSRRKEDDMSFDIKRAYEKWLEELIPGRESEREDERTAVRTIVREHSVEIPVESLLPHVRV